jgi:hypothetical protein
MFIPNKEYEFNHAILQISMDGLREGCKEFFIVFNKEDDPRDRDERTIKYTGNSPHILSARIYSAMHTTGLIVNRIYYHKVTKMDLMVIGVETCNDQKGEKHRRNMPWEHIEVEAM